MPEGESDDVRFHGLADALSIDSAQLRLFAKPQINGKRRLGVALAQGKDLPQALERAKAAAARVEVECGPR